MKNSILLILALCLVLLSSCSKNAIIGTWRYVLINNQIPEKGLMCDMKFSDDGNVYLVVDDDDKEVLRATWEIEDRNDSLFLLMDENVSGLQGEPVTNQYLRIENDTMWLQGRNESSKLCKIK